MAEKDAEIERLKEANKAITFQYLKARSLIIALADALERLSGYIRLTKEEAALIQRAREVTR